MIISLKKLKRFGFNEREQREEDFYRICEIEKITVLELNVPTSFYFACNGEFFIVIKKTLRGIKKTFSMFHELAHHFLHGGSSKPNAYFFGLIESRNELEADMIATVAMIPKNKIGCLDFLEEHSNRFAKKIWKDRQKLYFLYGI